MANEEIGGPPAAPDDHPQSTEDAASIEVPEGEDDIPAAPLWAMRTRMHSNRRLEPGEEGRIRRRVGEGDDSVYVIDDGLDHCMVGRRVGKASDGCVYCLVARIPL